MFNHTGPNSNASKNTGSQTTAAQLSADLKQEYHDFVADIEGLIKATTDVTGDELKQARKNWRREC